MARDGEKLFEAMGALGAHDSVVAEATDGQDMRCPNQGCVLRGVRLELDEISILDGEPRCAECHEVLIAWTDADAASA